MGCCTLWLAWAPVTRAVRRCPWGQGQPTQERVEASPDKSLTL